MKLSPALLPPLAITLRRISRRSALLLALLVLPLTWLAQSSDAKEIPQDIGSKIAFTSFRDGGANQIYIMNSDGSNQTRLSTNGNLDDHRPAFSPDGSKIVFDRDVGTFLPNIDIFAMNVDGTGVTQLTNFTAGQNYGPSFSPDGSKIIFTSDQLHPNAYTSIYTMNADGSDQTRVSPNDSVWDLEPAFSPDGSRIVFNSNRSGEFRIWTMNADGSNPTQVSHHPTGQNWYDERPTFSPDGGMIVYDSWRNTTGYYSIFVVNADGTGQTRLTNFAVDFRPSFSPGGTKIVFSRYANSQTHIYVMNLDGSGLQNISNNLGRDNEPSWGPLPPTTADLIMVSITDSPDPVQNNGDVRYQVTLHNSGPNTAKNVRVNMTVPNGTFVSSDLPHTVQNDIHSFFHPAMLLGEDFQFEVVFSAHQPPAGQPPTVVLNAYAFSGAIDPVPTNNFGTATTAIAQPPPPPPPGDLGATFVQVNERFNPPPPLADTVLRFAGVQQSRAAGLILRVEQSTTPSDPSSWTTLPQGGLMTLDPSSFDPEDDTSPQLYLLQSADYLNANGVYFRVVAFAPGHNPSTSNIVPDPAGPGLDLASKTPRLRPTTFRIAGLEVPRGILPGQKIPFLAVQPDYQVPGLVVSVETTTTPRDGLSWRPLTDAVMNTVCTTDVDPNFCQNGTTNFFHVRSSDYETGSVYFRAVSSANGYVRSVSRAIGPFLLTYDEPPQVLLTPPPVQNPARNAGGETPEVLLVTVDANDSDGTVQKVTLYVDGQPFLIKDTPPWVFNVETLAPGTHSLDAVAWDEVGGPGFSNHVGDFFVSDQGGFTFDRIADGAWNEATAWQPTGVPGPNDVARIYDRTVDLGGAVVAVTSLDLSGGRINGPGTLTAGFAKIGGAGSVSYFVETVLANLTVNVPAAPGLLLVDSPTRMFDGSMSGVVRFNNVTVNNHGQCQLSGNTLEAMTSTIFNYGISRFGNQLRNGLQGRATGARIGMVENHGTLDVSGASVQTSGVVQYNGQLITGAPIVAGGGGNALPHQAAFLDAANVISNDGAGLIGNDGAGLIGLDGASLIGSDAANLIGLDGASAITRPPIGRPDAYTSWQPTSTEPLVRLAGGILTGNGLIVGNVENAAGTIDVGDSPGALVIAGDYMQGPNASLVLDFVGRNGSAGQYDLFKISGDANLSGTLAIAPVPGATPGETAIVPLTYQSSTGGLSVPGSNAQITFNATGAIVIVQPSAPLDLVSVVSRKTHGVAGDFDISVPLTGAPGVECRTGGANGNHTLVFTFSTSLVGGNAAVTSGAGSVLGTPAISNDTMTVNLTGVADIQRLTVTLSGVTGSANQVLPDTPAIIKFLVGDTTGNGSVSASDIAQTKAQSGTTVTTSNFRSDVNASGTMTATDIAQVKSNSGHTVP